MGDRFLFLSAQDGQIVAMVSGCFAGFPAHGRGNPWRGSVGTQWETRGKNRRRGLGKKGFAQKKVLSLVLCVAMLLSVMVMGTGAVTLTDSEDISPQYREAAEVLTGMGIINGYEDDSFKPQQSITRAEVAAMIYRVATGDVEDEKADINAGAKIFTDVDADDWYAGYVNYCGDAEYIKGFEDDSFRADENVTGYQVLAMILRAVGYDKNNEFTGTNWTINVASTAAEVGMLKNVDSSVNLSAEAPRELVAEFIFQAIRPEVKTVHAAPILGQYVKDAESLGEKVFDLAVDTDTTDAWGRPATVWYAESNTAWNGIVKNNGYQSSMDDLFANIEETPLATYTTAVKVCDVADDLGIADKQDFTTYTNGKAAANTDEVTINANATTATIGAQGRLTEVYEDTIVYIDTFLARVDKVTEVKYDADGHVAKDASLTLTIYDGYNNPVTLTDDTNYTYAEGDMLLVNAYTADDGDHAAIAVDTNNIAKYVEFVGAAESFVGGQESIWKHPAYHTIDGEDYMDALHFHLNETGDLQTIDHNWWLDQYGNLIGVTNLDRTDYAVLKDLIWVNGGRDGGYAEATLIYMDGSEETVTVNTIDGVYYDSTPYWRVDDATPELDDSHYNIHFVGGDANVSSDSSNNGFYDGYALYNVYTNDDGTVNLEGWNDKKTNPDTAWIAYADGARIDIDGSTIRVGGTTVADVDNSTRFVVNNGDGTYSTYTGTANLPDFAAGTVEVFWSTAGTFTQNVYVKSYVEQATFGTHLFSVSDAHSWKLTDGDAVVYGMNVIVDGVERFILTEKENVIDLIEANTGKLMHVDFDRNANSDTYGYVEDVKLVNEGNDGINDGRNDGCNYLNTIEAIGDNAIKGDGVSYNLAYATEIIYSDKAWEYGSLEEAVENGCDVWVVDDVDNISSKAFTVYVGTALSADDTITVSATAVADGETNNIADIALENTTYTVTLDDRNTEGELTISADNRYALYTVAVGKSTETFRGDEVWRGPVNLDDTITVTVYAEDGVAQETWTINVSEYVKVDGAITSVTSSGQNITLGGKSYPLPMYSTFDDATSNAAVLNKSDVQQITIHADNNLVVANLLSTDPTYANAVAKQHRFTSAEVLNADTLANANGLSFTNGISEGIGDIQGWDAGDYYVIRMNVRPDGANSYNSNEYVYFAFQVQ